jgi:NitT/TauT family transport system ATP-binding protein
MMGGIGTNDRTVSGHEISPAVQPLIQIDSVQHWFRDPRNGSLIHAVSGADLAVARGEFVSILGPSGCGKTTLLNIVSGLDHPTKGVVRINNQRVTGVQPELIGYMFARDTLLPWRTAQSNVEFGISGLSVPDTRAKAKQFLELVGLTDFGELYPDQLSHGMRQRVALARTLAGDPEILLMDEPFGALDAQTKLLMEEEFIRIWEANKKTVLFVTHDIVEAVMLSDRVLVMSARPCCIKAEYRINFPRPREADILQTDPKFNELVRTIWHDLKTENLRGAA